MQGLGALPFKLVQVEEPLSHLLSSMFFDYQSRLSMFCAFHPAGATPPECSTLRASHRTSRFGDRINTISRELSTISFLTRREAGTCGILFAQSPILWEFGTGESPIPGNAIRVTICSIDLESTLAYPKLLSWSRSIGISHGISSGELCRHGLCARVILGAST
jgi:hypothetical protein